MKSLMRREFEKWHGFEVCDDMDIQTSVAWDNWKVAWKAAMKHAKVAAEGNASPCPTCEALARAVMMDQTGRA
jgi:pterin-4a-carbinolamine dehydratase